MNTLYEGQERKYATAVSVLPRYQSLVSQQLVEKYQPQLFDPPKPPKPIPTPPPRPTPGLPPR